RRSPLLPYTTLFRSRDVAAETVKGERHPLRRQHVQVSALWKPVRCECEEQSGDECGRSSSRQLAHEQVGAQARQDERREEQQVEIGRAHVCSSHVKT